MSLPDKLSELLRVAVADAQKCEADPRYRLRMDRWHAGMRDSPTCDVCMAGAVMAKTLGADPLCSVSPNSRPEDASKLRAIDQMRYGDFPAAASRLGINVDRAFLIPASRLVQDGFDALLLRRASWSVYLGAARSLEEAGL